MTRFVVRVSDINGREYTPPFFVARYLSNPRPGEVSVPVITRLAPGVPTDLQPAGDEVNLTVGTQAPGFSSETFTVRKMGGRWLADMRAATISVQGDTVLVDVVDGTIRLAPTIAFPPEQKVKENPRALLCEPGQGWIYYGAYLTNPTIRRLSNPAVFDSPTPAGYPSNDTAVKNEDSGNLVFLEYGFTTTPGAPRGPRFLIAVWAPRVALGTPPQVVVFYSPPTKTPDFPGDGYPFLGRYPYDIRAPAIAKDLVQPYPYHAINYLLAGYKIIPQIQAAGRNPIVIMPVNPTGGWGPLDTQLGLSRLIKEVVRFLYGHKLVSSRATPTARLSLHAGRASIFPQKGLFDDEPIPMRWALTVSGFSNGIDHPLNLCTSLPIDEKLYDPAIFASPETALVDSWREIWDIDGVADNGAGAERHLRNLQTWLKKERRTLRSYHSDYGMRTAPRTLVDPARVETRPVKPYKGVFISEGSSADGRATWVQFSDAALQPSPYDPHHTVPAIAFGHAARFALP
ncbi:hypothetical protein GCM10009733_050550 [Nonomuraea maheshkhaliensis]|uniref:Minor tail protein n=1 Tax=Nonomuraea maheshkhaliensis TaxID=419590 RepID=A0ABP4RFQ8_9ACTN